ncbi:hypothetical protein [Clostridium cagae]|uniref:hypothetical protein n=1 Tax=Clostridium cagae TaxID=2080751 RepID=UPI00131A058C|nr:hypothetical protein [Clostridium cagae]
MKKLTVNEIIKKKGLKLQERKINLIVALRGNVIKLSLDKLENRKINIQKIIF